MTERSTFDSFEQRIAAELERYVAPATDPKPASEIAAVAMRPRRLVVRARNVSQPRRLLLLGLAAAFLVPAAYIGASNLRPPAPDQAIVVQPAPTEDSLPTVVPSPAGSSDYASIFIRRDNGPEPGVSIFGRRSRRKRSVGPQGARCGGPWGRHAWRSGARSRRRVGSPWA